MYVQSIQVIYIYVLKLVECNICFRHKIDFPFHIYKSVVKITSTVRLRQRDQSMRSRQKKALSTTFNMILGIFQQDPFDIIAMTPRGILGLCCVHIAQLMTYLAIYTTPFTLQLCYKPLGILQRVTKSQKVHISSQSFITSD